ncbi:hypothetical protein GOP47_0012329 [Adiantum capillus-veneris]|uniref:phosphoglycerate dehydrogenase n=1 Tax=Adiantum capillus-veneris TaxID=13818 RepID=A0A9D4UQG8_ADICA|nr:hypothetical protein GOP47_0012329 [Adiantum capillus-veneris]
MAAWRVASLRCPASDALLCRRMCMKRVHSALVPQLAAVSTTEVPARPSILVADQKLTESGLKILPIDTMVTRQLFEASKGRLKVVGKAGAGLLYVDLQAATEYGCLVVNATNPHPQSAALHVQSILNEMRGTRTSLDVAVVGRGKEALLEALDSGVVAKALFTEEPSKLDNKLAGHKNVIVKPHPRASMTTGGPQCFAGRHSSLSAVNAWGVHKNVLESLAPYMPLAKKLGQLMQQVAVGSAVKSVKVLYRKYWCRPVAVRNLETFLLRPMIIKGLVENSRTKVNLVNADYLAEQQGLVIAEDIDLSDEEEGFVGGRLKSIQVKTAQVESKFAIAQLPDSGEIAFEGNLKHGCTPRLLKVGRVDDEPSVVALQRIEGIPAVEGLMFLNF